MNSQHPSPHHGAAIPSASPSPSATTSVALPPPASPALLPQPCYHQLVVTVSDLSASTSPVAHRELVNAHARLLEAMATLVGQASFFFSAIAYQERGFMLCPPTLLHRLLANPHALAFPAPAGRADPLAGPARVLDAFALFEQRAEKDQRRQGTLKSVVVFHTTAFSCPYDSSYLMNLVHGIKSKADLYILDHQHPGRACDLLGSLATPPRGYQQLFPGTGQLEAFLQNLGHGLVAGLGRTARY